MSRATITLESDLLDELVKVLHAHSKTEAVMMAVKSEIRKKKLEHIKSMAGKLEFVEGAENFRHTINERYK